VASLQELLDRGVSPSRRGGGISIAVQNNICGAPQSWGEEYEERRLATVSFEVTPMLLRTWPNEQEILSHLDAVPEVCRPTYESIKIADPSKALHFFENQNGEISGVYIRYVSKGKGPSADTTVSLLRKITDAAAASPNHTSAGAAALWAPFDFDKSGCLKIPARNFFDKDLARMRGETTPPPLPIQFLDVDESRPHGPFTWAISRLQRSYDEADNSQILERPYFDSVKEFPRHMYLWSTRRGFPARVWLMRKSSNRCTLPRMISPLTPESALLHPECKEALALMSRAALRGSPLQLRAFKHMKPQYLPVRWRKVFREWLEQQSNREESTRAVGVLPGAPSSDDALREMYYLSGIHRYSYVR
jgi:hypothetical protein